MSIRSFIKTVYYKLFVPSSVRIPLSAILDNKVSFEGCCQLHPHVKFCGHLGYGSYIGPYSKVSAKIGRFTSIASYVCTVAGRHAYQAPFATTCPMFFSLNPNHSQSGSTFATESRCLKN